MDDQSSSVKTFNIMAKDCNAHSKAELVTDVEERSKEFGNGQDSPADQQAICNADNRRNVFANSSEMPREVDLFGEDNIEDILEMMDSLRASIEQLQLHCEKLATEKSKLEQTLIDKEREHLDSMERYQEELLSLRKVNVQLSQGAQNAYVHEMGDPPKWVKDALDTEQLHREKIEAIAKSESLRLTVMERDKIISNLEWQVMDCEATITSLQAERDKIAFELDYNLAREQEELEVFGAVGEDRYGYGSHDRLAASYAESPQHLRKPPQRHYSDLSCKRAPKVEVIEGLSSASWLDEPAESDFGAGRLKRTTNFSNINDLDESENYDDDNHSMLSDYVSESDRALDQLPEPTPLSKINRQKWQSFGSDSGEWQDGGRGRSPVARVSSAVSDLCTWQSLSEHEDLPQTPLAKVDTPKKDSSPHAPPSHGDSAESNQADLWSFTPDSILNVTTGEEISNPEPQNPRKMNAALTASGPVQNENNATFVAEKYEVHNEIVQNKEAGTLADENTNLCMEMAPDTAKRKQSGTGPKQSQRILEEYQKWKVTGRKGDPPAKLKISQC